MKALPPPSTAAQKDGDVHATPGWSEAPVSSCCGAVQVVPLNVSTFSKPSIAAQNAEDGHETESSEPPSNCPFVVSIGSALLQVPLLYVKALPAVSTATQKLVEGHDTDVRLLEPMICGLVQLVPPFVEVSTEPAWPTATQNDVDGQAM